MDDGILLAELIVEVRERPVSINDAYTTFRGRRLLTKEGKRFESLVSAAVSEAIGRHDLNWKDVVGAVYKHGGSVRLLIELYLDDLMNGAWTVGGGMTRGGKKARTAPKPRSPYRKVDGSNYIKLLEDGVVNGTGIDDSCHLETNIRKIQSADPRVRIIYRVYE